MKHYTALILLLLIPLLLFAYYGMSPEPVRLGMVTFEKADFSALERFIESHRALFERRRPDTATQDSLREVEARAPFAHEEAKPDTSAQRILFFGDSMVEGLGPRMGEYAAQNGHSLTYVCWYSSESRTWAESDTLQHFLKEVEPTYVVISLGGNEQFVRNLKQREHYIAQVLQQVAHVPHIWICTPSWKGDTGFNALAERLVGKGRFYDSRHLTLERAKDHAHPTREESRRWMDSLAVWMQSDENAHPIRMQRPEAHTESTHRAYFLNSN